MAQTQEFRGVARQIVNTTNGLVFYYHNTPIVKVTDDYIELNSGGWRTATTKLAMNQASNQFGLGFSVFQKDYDWYVYVEKSDGLAESFYDGMTLAR